MSSFLRIVSREPCLTDPQATTELQSQTSPGQLVWSTIRLLPFPDRYGSFPRLHYHWLDNRSPLSCATLLRAADHMCCRACRVVRAQFLSLSQDTVCSRCQLERVA